MAAAAATSPDRSGGEASGDGPPADHSSEANVLQTLGRPVVPPLLPAQHSSGSSVPFLPHSLLPPRHPPPPAPPKLSELFSVLVPPTRVRVPIPQGLPPGPWLPEDISPAVPDSQRLNYAAASRTKDFSPLDNVDQRNIRLKNAANLGFYASSHNNLGDWIRHGSNGNGDDYYCPTKYDRKGQIRPIRRHPGRIPNMNQMRHQCEVIQSTYLPHPSSLMSQKWIPVEQKKPPPPPQLQLRVHQPKIKQEWVPVGRSLDIGNDTSEVEINHVLKQDELSSSRNRCDQHIELSMSQKFNLQELVHKSLPHLVQKSKLKQQWVPVRRLSDQMQITETDAQVLQNYYLSCDGCNEGDGLVADHQVHHVESGAEI